MRSFAKVTVAAILGFAALGQAGWSQHTAGASLAEEIRASEASTSDAQNRGSGESWLKLAQLYQDAAQFGNAERAYNEAIRLLRPGSPDRLAYALDSLGTLFAQTGAFAKAEPLEQQALTIRQDRRDSLGTGRSRMHLAVLNLGQHKLTEASEQAEQAVAILVPELAGQPAASGATPEEKMTAVIDLSLARCAQKRCADSLPELRWALAFATSKYTAKSMPVGFLNFLVGYASWKSGESQGAGERMKAGLADMETELGWGHPTYVAAKAQYEGYLRETARIARR